MVKRCNVDGNTDATPQTFMPSQSSSSGLLNLPWDVKHRIYVFALTFDEARPYSSPTFKHLGRICTTLTRNCKQNLDRAPLLRACGQLYAETKDLFYQSNLFEFSEFDIGIVAHESYQKWLQQRTAPLRYLSIRSSEDSCLIDVVEPPSAASPLIPKLQAMEIRCFKEEYSLSDTFVKYMACPAPSAPRLGASFMSLCMFMDPLFTGTSHSRGLKKCRFYLPASFSCPNEARGVESACRLDIIVALEDVKVRYHLKAVVSTDKNKIPNCEEFTDAEIAIARQQYWEMKEVWQSVYDSSK